MKRALPWILALLVAGGAAASFHALTKRTRGAAPAQGPAEAALFTASPAGDGVLLSLNASASQPLRMVHFLPPLADGTVIAQALTQTGEQILGLFQEGKSGDPLRIPLPDGVPDAFFRFARVQDAARLEGGSLLLLFVDGTGGSSAPWLVEVDEKTGEARWAVKAAGAHLALEPGAMSCLVWDAHALGRATWNAEPDFKPLPLPGGISILDAVQPLEGRRMALAHPGGLARLAGGAWSMTPLPDPGDLAFPGMPGALARAGSALYWQPRPGQLGRLERDGSLSPVDLGKLAMPQGHEKDAALLRLAGADAKGRLWFTLATPDLTVGPHPSLPAAGADAAQGAQPSAALQAMAAMNGSAASPQAAATAAPTFDPAAWMEYLKGGLDRVYVWDPAKPEPRMVDWKASWAALGAPPDFTLPLARHLRPEGGALLLDLDTRAWWVPLGKL